MTTRNNTQWHEDAINLYKKGMGKAEIFRALMPDNEELTYDKVRHFIDRCKLKNINVETDDANNNDYASSTNMEYKNGETTFSRIIALQNGENVTPEMMLKAHSLDPLQWEVTSYKNNWWQSQKKDGITLDLYQSKLTARPTKNPLPTIDEVQELFRDFKAPKVATKYQAVNPKADTMVEINIADLHLGKLAWAPEAGESYDYKIAQKRFYSIIDQEITRMKDKPVEKILFVWSNDFFNSDGISEATTGGTPQNNDLRWKKVYLVGIEMLFNAITKLSEVAPVETFLISSNHSMQAEFYAICNLEALFRGNKRVTVHMNCKTRFYYRYGCNLIGFSHSYYESKTNLPGLMQVEAPEDWGNTTYREFHLAHYHCEKVEEKNGIIFRWLPSVTGPDAWHESKGFVGAVERSYSFVWSKKKGLMAINVDYPA